MMEGERDLLFVCLFKSRLWAEFGHILWYYKLMAYFLPVTFMSRGTL